MKTLSIPTEPKQVEDVDKVKKKFASLLSCMKIYEKHYRLNAGRIALERLVGGLINRSLLQSGGGGVNVTKVQ